MAHKASGLMLILALALTVLAGASVASNGEEGIIYEFTMNGTSRGGVCGVGSWNMTGVAVINLIENNTTVKARVDVNYTSISVRGGVGLGNCADILLAREGFGNGFTYRFPVNASYPHAPLWHAPSGVEGNQTISVADAEGWVVYCKGFAVEGVLHVNDTSLFNASYTLSFHTVKGHGPCSGPATETTGTSGGGSRMATLATAALGGLVAVVAFAVIRLVLGRGGGSGRP